MHHSPKMPSSTIHRAGSLNMVADAKYGKTYFSLKAGQRHAVLKTRKNMGDSEQQLGGKMQALATLQKRQNPEVAAKARADRRFVHKELFPP
jgi:hypothetical protein